MFEDMQSELMQCKSLQRIVSNCTTIRNDPDSQARSVGFRMFKLFSQHNIVDSEMLQAIQDGINEPTSSNCFVSALQCIPFVYAQIPHPNEEITAHLLLLFEQIQERLLALYNAADFNNFVLLFLISISFLSLTFNK